MRCALLAALLAGCAAPAPDGSTDVPGGASGGSFAIAPPERVVFAASDGIDLVATLWRPVGVDRAPVILHAQPYASGCSMPGSVVFGDPYPQPCRPPTSDEFWLDEYNGAPRALVASGFAFVDLNVRGTGESGGCFSLNGPEEREDLRVVLDALANASWSTGRLGMMGLSYMGTTPFVALGHRHPALQAVVAGGIGTNEYYYRFTPQGAGSGAGGLAFAPFWLGSIVGPQLGGGPNALPGAATTYPERWCPEFVEGFANAGASTATEARERAYFLARRHVAHVKDVNAGVLVVQGLPDRAGLQWEPLWDALGDAPKSLVLGDWPHRFPDTALLAGSGLAWPDLPIAWFDHFLRDGPAPSSLGRVHHEVPGREWRVSDAWPALASEALYLDGSALAAAPGAEGLAFASVPGGAACGAPGTWAVAMTKPLERPALLAGNPMAWLEVRVDAPAAVIAVDVWDVPGDDVCEGEILTMGAADLRFLDDPFTGRDVPAGAPLGVRVDLYGVSHEVPAGHRLAVTFSASGGIGAQGRPTTATVEILPGASHLLVPTGAGLGAPPPDVAYPPMPLGPAWSDA